MVGPQLRAATPPCVYHGRHGLTFRINAGNTFRMMPSRESRAALCVGCIAYYRGPPKREFGTVRLMSTPMNANSGCEGACMPPPMCGTARPISKPFKAKSGCGGGCMPPPRTEGPGIVALGGDPFTCVSKVSLSCISAWKRLHSSLCC